MLGRHAGVHHFTVGQRKGLGLAALKGAQSQNARPLYVVQIEPASRRVIVGAEAELLGDTCNVRDVNWIAWERLEKPVEAMVKIRYRHEPALALIEPCDEPRDVRAASHSLTSHSLTSNSFVMGAMRAVQLPSLRQYVCDFTPRSALLLRGKPRFSTATSKFLAVAGLSKREIAMRNRKRSNPGTSPLRTAVR